MTFLTTDYDSNSKYMHTCDILSRELTIISMFFRTSKTKILMVQWKKTAHTEVEWSGVGMVNNQHFTNKNYKLREKNFQQI